MANSTETATIETSPVTGVRFEKEYSVGPPSSRNASNQPFMLVAVADVRVWDLCEPKKLRYYIKSIAAKNAKINLTDISAWSIWQEHLI